MTAATQIQWRVQVRKERHHVWKNKGLFETRASARSECFALRCLHHLQTRIVPYVKAKKGQGK